ncbi:MAG: MerR family transcriptional regulator [Dehalococcoidia bacterium]
MSEHLTIGVVARRSGVPVRTIRFYEAEGLLPTPARTAAGYRLYTTTDVRRLRLVRRVRLLGLPLTEVKALVEQAFASECAANAHQLLDLVDLQRAELDRRIAELQALRTELDAIAEHVHRAAARAPAGLRVAACGCCPLIDEATGAQGYCRCETPADAVPNATVLPGRSDTHMSGHHIAPEDVLETLACTIDERPADAPTLDDLVPMFRGTRREPGALVVEFDPAAADTVEAFADAERRCCAGIGWDVEHGPAVNLHITATPDQLDALAGLWPRRSGNRGPRRR